ncbi:MAG TPA: YSC84-related protein [Terriglobales bacterium]|jgi:lipid-binding SYLF domain-containing protein|nr:YSC84-related protein [Terriglobales bacterium]
MRRVILALLATIVVWGTTVWAAEDDRAKELDRIQAATTVLNEIIATPDKGIPEDILAGAQCVVVVPSMKKGGFVFGATYGKGVATCHNGNRWSAPAPIKIAGGSWGAQIGGEAVDLLMLVMNQKGMQNLLDSKFKIGADVSGAAGPIGRHAEASTDWQLRSEVLTYSRARGAFAGITLNGAAITQDDDDTKTLYGHEVPFRQILSGAVAPPAGTEPFLQTVARDFRAAKTAQSSKSTSTGSAGGVTGALTGQGEAARPAPARSVPSAAANRPSDNPEAATPVSDARQVQEDLASSIKDQLGNDASGIMISVSQGTIRLSGHVPTNEARDKAIQVAQSKAGDRRVDASTLSVR